MVPRLRFKEFKTPWKNILFKDICSDFSYGIGASAKEYDGSNKYLRITDIDEESSRFLPNPLTSPDGEIEDKYILKTGDIVFARTGASVGKSYLYNEKDGNLIFAGFLIKASIKDGVPEFVFQSTLTKKYKNWVHVFSMRSGQPGINAQEYSSYKLSLPKIEEQQKIASFLSSVDEKISQLEKKKTLLETYKRGIMQRIFSQELRFKDENGQEFPDWEEKRLGEIIRILSDYTANGSFAGLKENVQYYSESNFAALVRTTDLEKKKFEPKRFTDQKGYEYLKKTKLFGGEIIMANVGSIGKVYRAPKFDNLMTLAPNTYMIKFINDIDEDFIFQYMLRSVFKNNLLSMVGSSTLKAINKSNLRSIKVFLPKRIEQKKIASFLSSIDKKIEITSTQLEKTREFKKGLLQQMFV